MSDDGVIAFLAGMICGFILLGFLATCGMTADEGARYARCKERGGVAIFVNRTFALDSVACVKGEVLKTTALDTLP